MNKPDSYLDKTKYYLAQLEVDFDVRLQKVQPDIEVFKVILWLIVIEGEMRAIYMGFYPTADQALPIHYLLEESYLNKPIPLFLVTKE